MLSVFAFTYIIKQQFKALELDSKVQKMSTDQYLAGKLALVTGASKPNGIGAATAYSLASHGANVCIDTLDS